VRGDDHDGTWSGPQNAFGYRADEQPLDTRSAVRTHDDEIGGEAAGSRNDDVGDARPVLHLDVHRSIACASVDETAQVMDGGCGSRLEHGGAPDGKRPDISTSVDWERRVHM